jgi:hypothetical protein
VGLGPREAPIFGTEQKWVLFGKKNKSNTFFTLVVPYLVFYW